MVTNRVAYLGRLYASVNRVKPWLGLSFNPGMLAAESGLRWKTRGARRSETGDAIFLPLSSFVLLPTSPPSDFLSIRPIEISRNSWKGEKQATLKLCFELIVSQNTCKWVNVNADTMFWRHHPKENVDTSRDKFVTIDGEANINKHRTVHVLYILGRRSLAKGKFWERGWEGEDRPRSILLAYVSCFYYYSSPVAVLFKLFYSSIVNSIVSLFLWLFLLALSSRIGCQISVYNADRADREISLGEF